MEHRRCTLPFSIIVLLTLGPARAANIFYGEQGAYAQVSAQMGGTHPRGESDFSDTGGPVSASVGGNVVAGYAQPGRISFNGTSGLLGYADSVAGTVGFLEGVLLLGVGTVSINTEFIGNIHAPNGCGSGFTPCANLSYRTFQEWSGGGQWGGLIPVLGPSVSVSYGVVITEEGGPFLIRYGVAIFGNAAGGGGWEIGAVPMELNQRPFSLAAEEPLVEVVRVTLDPTIKVLGTTSGTSVVYFNGSPDPFTPPRIGQTSDLPEASTWTLAGVGLFVLALRRWSR